MTEREHDQVVPHVCLMPIRPGEQLTEKFSLSAAATEMLYLAACALLDILTTAERRSISPRCLVAAHKLVVHAARALSAASGFGNVGDDCLGSALDDGHKISPIIGTNHEKGANFDCVSVLACCLLVAFVVQRVQSLPRTRFC